MRSSVSALLVLVYFDLLLLSCLSFHGSAGAGAARPRLGEESDRWALLQFKAKITRDRLGILNSWNHTLPVCQWHGVTCGRQHQRVVALELYSAKLVGSISPHLGNMSFLRMLNLSNNNLGSEIPRDIWDLGRLENLTLANNSLVGIIPPNISCSSKLKYLDLSGNLLTGELPVKLGCLSHLQWLQLSRNKFIGKLPPSLGNLSSLKELSLAHNNMGGVIPESLGQLKSAILFAVRGNGFSGFVPSSIFNLSNLLVLLLQDNQLQGSLPADFGLNMPRLEAVGLFGNQFTGSLPSSISNATHVIRFEGGSNRFTGSVPSLGNLNNLNAFGIETNHLGSGEENDLNFICSAVNITSLEILALAANNLGGVIPTCIGNLSKHLRVIDLSSNKVSGKIPSALGDLINLEWLSLFDNQLSGHIPPSIGSLNTLKYLYLSSNHLSGNIPISFGNLKIMTELCMDQNNLEGTIPPSLGECGSLIVLDISDNNLSGLIPQELFSLAPFSIGMLLSGNQFTGNIPPQVGNLKNIGLLGISSNLLSGEIPQTLGSCQSLETLNLSGNLLQGSIPTSLSSLRGLQALNLSNNKLTGEIPRFLVSLKLLNVLDLSHNDFKGFVPSEGIFLNASATSLIGNDKLCGGVPELYLPKCNTHRSKKNWKVIVLIISLIFGAAFVVFVLLCFWLQMKGNKSMTSNSVDQFTELSYHSLFKATDGFSPSNLIGTGSFGAVYKGMLDGGTTLVAIKVFDLLQHRASKSFMAECNALRSIRHRNLVKILTVCSSIDYQGNDFKALVYEFMSNGSLDEWLHHTFQHNDSSKRSPKNLSLVQRLNIAIDVGFALDYLHHQCETPIVHCDLKPSNVLLNEDMTAHLGDFGLVRFLAGARDGSLQNDTSSIGVRGSIGYTAPECGMGGKISTKGDVYSYGMLLLEMLTGKRPTDEIFQDGLNLHTFVKNALGNNVWDIIDKTLLCGNNEEPVGISIVDDRKGSRQLQRIQDCLISIFKIGVTCSVEHPGARMNMSDVVTQLCSTKNKLLRTGIYQRSQHL